ncbi:metal-dependent hydrolase [Natronorubrum halophilum]|uniref:metal-dependent hydrolase n=1 Tax=Natronorubrum halophilum TaxID=1702106 RepID=UPI000EF64E8D|nr:metal-dependent hydrolase [Natronorubrum halophilum]
MYRGGHVGFNALLYAPFVPVLSRYWSLEIALLGAALALAVANLPDIDQSLPRLPHRGPTHTIWFAVLVGVAAGGGTALVARSTPQSFLFGFAIGTGGVLAHLAGDIVTPMGICPFAPVSRFHVTLNWFKSKNSRINRVLLLVGLSALSASVLLTVGLSTGAVHTG